MLKPGDRATQAITFATMQSYEGIGLVPGEYEIRATYVDEDGSLRIAAAPIRFRITS